MADAITDAMIEAGKAAYRDWVKGCSPRDPADLAERVHAAMEAARQRQLPSDDGLIKALEKARDFLREAPLESGVCCCGDKVEHHNIGSGHSPVDELQYHASNLAEEIDEALSRHKASVAGDGVERLKRELLAALSISRASRFHSAEMTEGVLATVEYLANSFRLETDPDIQNAIRSQSNKVSKPL